LARCSGSRRLSKRGWITWWFRGPRGPGPESHDPDRSLTLEIRQRLHGSCPGKRTSAWRE
jgi:hypothetical protein